MLLRTDVAIIEHAAMRCSNRKEHQRSIVPPPDENQRASQILIITLTLHSNGETSSYHGHPQVEFWATEK